MITMSLKFEDDEVMNEPIEVLAWSWGFSGDANGLQDISLTKYIGVESARCLELANGATMIKRATLVCEGDLQRITIDLKGVRISHQSIGGSGGEDRLTENIGLAFAEVTFKTEIFVDGGTRGHATNVKK